MNNVDKSIEKKIFEISTSFDGLRVPLNKNQRKNIPGKYPYYGASGQIDNINDYKFDGEFLLIAEDGENLKTQKKPIAYIVNGKFWANNHVHVIKPNNEIDIEFLCHYMNSLNIMDYAKEQVTRPKLKKSTLDQIPVHYPANLRIQQKIIKKIECFNNKLQEAKNEMLKNRTIIEDSLNEKYQILLGRKISDLMFINSTTTSYIKKSLSELTESILPGFAEGNKNVTDGIIHLRMNNIGVNFKLNLDLIRRINPSKSKLSKYQLKNGDIIFNNTNSSKLVGKTAIFDRNETCLYSNHLTRIRVKKQYVIPEWILFYLRARWLKEDFKRMCNRWINQASITKEKIENLQIPVPPLEIQKKILNNLNMLSLVMAELKEKLRIVTNINKDTDSKLEILKRKMVRYYLTNFN